MKNAVRKLDAYLESYQSQIKRSKKFLQTATDTSLMEVKNLLFSYLDDPSTVNFIRLAEKIMHSGIWVGHSYTRFLHSLLMIRPKRQNKHQKRIDEEILEHISKKIPIESHKFSQQQIFKAIFYDREQSHFEKRYVTKIAVPHKDCSIALVSGVYNEIFSSAAFERAAQHLSTTSGFDYFVPKVNGRRSSNYNAVLLKRQFEEYIDQNPHKKIWIIGFSKGGIDALHYMAANSEFANRHILGLSTIASPILGSEHIDNKVVKFINEISEAELNKVTDFFQEIFGKDIQRSLKAAHLRPWFRNHHQKLPTRSFYTAIALHSEWYESHFWMILAKLLIKHKDFNDGVVEYKNAQYPKYFGGINLGLIRGHHLIGSRSSFYCQEALIEALVIYLDYLELI